MINEPHRRLQKTPRLLDADPRRCTGCGMCRLICSMVKEGRVDVPSSRIHLLRYVRPQLHLPVICRHCEDAPCMKICPRDAIFRDQAVESVLIDYDRCISCKMCVAACPFGAMGFNGDRHMVFKCDLCKGNPQCVRFCFPGALTYATGQRQAHARAKAAGRLRLAGGKIR